MRGLLVICGLLAAGCGLENVFKNAAHDDFDRPASMVTGAAPEQGDVATLSVIDGDGTEIEPFLAQKTGTAYELRLPSSKYSMLRVRAQIGNMELRSLVPSIGEESALAGVDLDARNMTETLITEARLSADGDTLKKVTPEAYLGTRALIRAAFDQPGPTQELLQMVERLMTRVDPSQSVLDPEFFRVPEYCMPDEEDPTACEGAPAGGDYVVKSGAIDASALARNPFDYVGDGRARIDSVDFDTKLAEVARLYRPLGCPDPDRIKLVFTADFNEGAKTGLCTATSRFKWATDRPGKSMFFVGWIYDGSAGRAPSDIQDPNITKLLGSASPNVLPMYDDGTNGDQTAGDNIWSITFDVPRSSPGNVLRIGYKYTWGTSGAPWTGSEEWPGNSRILEVVDDNADEFVYRRDTFGDEATNKDKSNAHPASRGSIDWPTDLHGCGPESHENGYDYDGCTCGSIPTPDWIGPLTVTCTQ